MFHHLYISSIFTFSQLSVARSNCWNFAKWTKILRVGYLIRLKWEHEFSFQQTPILWPDFRGFFWWRRKGLYCILSLLRNNFVTLMSWFELMLGNLPYRMLYDSKGVIKDFSVGGRDSYSTFWSRIETFLPQQLRFMEESVRHIR